MGETETRNGDTKTGESATERSKETPRQQQLTTPTPHRNPHREPKRRDRDSCTVWDAWCPVDIDTRTTPGGAAYSNHDALAMGYAGADALEHCGSGTAVTRTLWPTPKDSSGVNTGGDDAVTQLPLSREYWKPAMRGAPMPGAAAALHEM